MPLKVRDLPTDTASCSFHKQRIMLIAEVCNDELSWFLPLSFSQLEDQTQLGICGDGSGVTVHFYLVNL